MITIDLPAAQQILPDLARKALGGEDVRIAIGDRLLRLVPDRPRDDQTAGIRLGRGSWRGRLTVLPGFHDPLNGEEIGEPDC